MRIFTTEFTGSRSYYLIVGTDFTVDFSGGTRRGRRVPFTLIFYPTITAGISIFGFKQSVVFCEYAF